MSVSAVGQTSATLTWGASSSSEGIDKYIITVNGEAVAETSNLSYELTDLTPNTSYSAFVRAQSTAGQVSNPSGVAEFTTLPEELDVESVTVEPSTLELYVGEIELLNAVVLPVGAVRTVEWTSSDEEVAEVSESGLVTAKAEGVATITAMSTENISMRGECVVTVTLRDESDPDPDGEGDGEEEVETKRKVSTKKK